MSTGNYMIDGDDGSHSFSPRHISGPEVKIQCDFCRCDAREDLVKPVETTKEKICIYCIESLTIPELSKHYEGHLLVLKDHFTLKEMITEIIPEIWPQKKI